MPATYAQPVEALTPTNIVASYKHVYRSIHGTQPECYHMDSHWFMVDGIRRDRNWLSLEIERLRQEALVDALDQSNKKPASSIFRLIRCLSRL